MVDTFREVKASGQRSYRADREHEVAYRLVEALNTYLKSHHHVLPGRDWKAQLAAIDPSLNSVLSEDDGNGICGFAAFPNVLGKKIDALAPQTILFAWFRSSTRLDVLTNPKDIEAVGDRSETAVISVENFKDGRGRLVPSLQVAYWLGQQGGFKK